MASQCCHQSNENQTDANYQNIHKDTDVIETVPNSRSNLFCGCKIEKKTAWWGITYFVKLKRTPAWSRIFFYRQKIHPRLGSISSLISSVIIRLTTTNRIISVGGASGSTEVANMWKNHSHRYINNITDNKYRTVHYLRIKSTIFACISLAIFPLLYNMLSLLLHNKNVAKHADQTVFRWRLIFLLVTGCMFILACCSICVWCLVIYPMGLWALTLAQWLNAVLVILQTSMIIELSHSQTRYQKY